ncbi:TonB-dependent receptor plug domain-containing protein [Flavobacterium sp. Fl-77]|uniref:TonB-dependent receptor plug domain-containing protein n=2 Tax=Flavobacterium flavipigmentatum TaxID=2893884 RepID=A0AAJ2VWY0_9FLAO|nr:MULTISPECIES: TonB-dependent receptor plug domain-containing protein [unclassified Flavobacterium]MDX6182464.1 TonB-dependent receptor plug domain-containing protein [Flavobacterium sp. Fl-33]MDX6185623.1 TonB-dependent receptor plug domain-containing protein [Flavobacterium sp. Fl-77]UFH38809.1 TonB-dependent receptor [Flavobacterium sp. F-70]
MNNNKLLFVFLFLGIGYFSMAQNARVKGVILDIENHPVTDVNISCSGNVSQSDANGFFEIEVASNKKTVLVFTHISLKMMTLTVTLKPNETFVFNPVMSGSEEQMGEVFVSSRNKKRVQGITIINSETIRKIPGANAGIENILKTLPGVNSNNELSTQYAVRGGNYDENLVYVNEIEVYRPFLIRSGQQEGLSFTNTDLVQNIDFSAGGFSAKFGDKLSSVLDITYRKPTEFGAVLEASFLGGSFAVDAVSKNKKWSAVTGVRYRNNSLLVNSQDTQTNYTPTFADIQTNINYDISEKWQMSFLGNISQNKYLYRPLTRETKFGTIDQPMSLAVYYEGQEKDQYDTYFGAFKTIYKVSQSFNLKLISSLFHTTEQEHFDILAQYRLGNVNPDGTTNPDNVDFTRGIGSQLNHARNDLDALIANIEIKGFKEWQTSELEFGLKYTRESIRDRIVEWEVIDSAGFSINPPIIVLPRNNQPDVPYTGPLLPYQDIRATNFNTINRFSGFTQWSNKGALGSSEIWYTIGARFQSWQVSGAAVEGKNQVVFSPRAQFAIKPDWEKDMVFRISGGLYHQPPFYRELRDADGVVNPDVKAQQSVHIVLSNDYSFKMWDRPFKWVTELYYKSLTDVNTYSIDNVRIRYVADNNAKAYAQGLDFRLNGEFVPGTESWISFGYLKTEENYQNKGFIARPTDQRLKFAMLFQDYMPNIPSVKLYLNLVYNTGLPGGSPSYSDPYFYQNRLNDYRRVDVGFSKVFVNTNTKVAKANWLKNFKELSLGLEIFNLFNNQNAITNTWVRDVYSKNQYAIPNYMTSRVFNLKLNARL